MKKVLSLLLVMIMTVGLLAGCNQPSQPAETTTSAPATETTQATEAAGPLDAYTAENPITISFWNFPNFVGDAELPGREYDTALIKAFEEKYPNIKVEYQAIEFSDGPAKLETAIQSNTQPDLVYDAPGRVIDWASKGYLVPLDDIVDASVLNAQAVKASSYDGKVYLYPHGIAPFLMGFNVTMLKELGIDNLLPLNNPDRNWTVKEFEALITAIHEKKPEVAPVILYTKSQAGDQGPRAFVSNLFDSAITNDDVTEYTINNENGVKAMEWIKASYDKGLLGSGISLDAGAAIEEFGNGTAAGSILYPVVKYKQFTNDGKMESVLLPLPNDSGTPKLEYLVAGPAIFDNGNADKVVAAKLLIDFMVNDEAWGLRTLKATGNFAAKNGVTGLYEDPELLFAESTTKYFGTYYNTVPGFIQMRQLWFPMVQAILNGDEAPKAALDKFVEQANQTIKDAQ